MRAEPPKSGVLCMVPRVEILSTWRDCTAKVYKESVSATGLFPTLRSFSDIDLREFFHLSSLLQELPFRRRDVEPTWYNIAICLVMSWGGYTYGFGFAIFVTNLGQSTFYKYFQS